MRVIEYKHGDRVHAILWNMYYYNVITKIDPNSYINFVELYGYYGQTESHGTYFNVLNEIQFLQTLLEIG